MWPCKACFAVSAEVGETKSESKDPYQRSGIGQTEVGICPQHPDRKLKALRVLSVVSWEIRERWAVWERSNKASRGLMDFISLFALRIGEVSYCVTIDYSKRRKVIQTKKRHEGWTIGEPPARQWMKLYVCCGCLMLQILCKWYHWATWVQPLRFQEGKLRQEIHGLSV